MNVFENAFAKTVNDFVINKLKQLGPECFKALQCGGN